MPLKHITALGALVLFLVVLVLFFIWYQPSQNQELNSFNTKTTKYGKKHIISGSFDKTKMKSDEEWKKILTPEQYYILREEGTETPYTGKLLNNHEKGTYYSVGCDVPLFRSETKYESGTGWPSFWKPIDDKNLVLKEDTLLGYTRTEVLDLCGNHLGHVFDDGPEPTGKRYCMNSIALRFVPD